MKSETVNEAETSRTAQSQPRCAPAAGSQLGLVIIFAIYSLLYEAIIWGIFGWAVFLNGRSGWWVVVAIICSGAQLKPKHFGITVRDDAENDGTQRPGASDAPIATASAPPGSLK